LFGVLAAALLGLANPQQASAQLPLTTSSTAPTVTKDSGTNTPSSTTDQNPCTGEFILVQGRSVVNFQQENTPSGNSRFRGFSHDFGQGQTCTGTAPCTPDPTGAQYEYSDMNEFVVEFKSNESGPSEFSMDKKKHMIRKAETTTTTGAYGGGDDYFEYSHDTVTFTNKAPSGMRTGQNRTQCR